MTKTNLKSLILLFSACFFIAFTAQAQDDGSSSEGTASSSSSSSGFVDGLHYGGKAGATFFNSFNNGRGSAPINFTVGGFANYSFSDFLALQLEVNYVRQGGVHQDQEVAVGGSQISSVTYSKRNVRLDNLVVPLLVRLNFEAGSVYPYALVGASYTWNMGVRESKDVTFFSDTGENLGSTSGTVENVTSFYARNVFNAELGAGAQFDMGDMMFFAETKYMRALTNMNPWTNNLNGFGDLYPSSLLVTVGVSF